MRGRGGPSSSRIAPRAPRPRAGPSGGPGAPAVVSPEVGAVHVRVLLDHGRRPLGDLASEVEDHDAVGDLHDQPHVVLDQEHRRAAGVADGAQELGERRDLLVVQPARGLVGQEQLRPAAERARQLDPLERAEREPRGWMIRDGLEIQEREELARRGADGLLLPADPGQAQRVREEIAARPAVDADHDVLEHRQRREEREVLERAADAELRDAMRRQRQERATLEEDGAAIRRVEPRETVEERGLARAVGADEPDDLAHVDVERDGVEGDDAPEAQREIAHAQDRQRQAGVKRGMLTSALTSSKVTRTGMPILSVAGSPPTRLVRTCTPSSSSTYARTYGSSSLKPRACVR